MKRTITKMAIALGIATTITTTAQTTTFETFTLSPNSFYQDVNSGDFSDGVTTFRYGWNPSSGGYWETGSAYTNVKDTVDGTYTNLYGCIPGTAFSGNNYATVKSGAIITFSNSNTQASGFYITNTTYAWKSIKKGDLFARRFGDTTGTGSGASIPQGEYPDWFKIIVSGYRSGNLLADTVEFYLADYRAPGTANDYVIKNWQYVDCSSLGQVDSIAFEIKSSDNSFGFMNTPGFFSIDNFTTGYAVGVNELANVSNLSLYPNPTTENINLNYASKTEANVNVSIYDITGKSLISENTNSVIGQNAINLQTSVLEAGVYFIELNDGKSSKKIKFIKL